MPASGQKIFRIRREYNAWVANESLEDYALRYTPRSFRKWSEFRVANTAFGAVSFLALEAIGGAIALNYGFTNALWAILVVGLIIFLTGLPISYYAARYGLDLDLLTRGAGFGYLGSTLTSLIYASFTFIFFALEAAIMALALQMWLGWSLPLCYILSSLVIIPLVIYGITMISRVQLWTQPLWAILLISPFLVVAVKSPESYVAFAGLTGRSNGSSEFDLIGFGMATTVALALIVQIGEQVDFLRFLPEKTRENRVRWWSAVLIAGPGWIVPGMLKMLGGAFLAFLALQHEVVLERAIEPTQMYLVAFQEVFGVPSWALGVTVLFVVVSQVKINVTNAYAGSLAWSNFFARLTHSHPGRVVWLVFNVLIAVMLMTLGVFGALEHVLGLYSNVAIGWVGALVADLVINKPMGWSPKGIEFKRAHLYDLNPVGLGATLTATLMAMLAHAGLFGPLAEAGSAFVALVTAMVVSPLIAWATGGRYYIARQPHTQWRPGQLVTCSVCENAFEAEDMASCPAYGAPICSLCCTLDSSCSDRCKSRSRAAEQVSDVLIRFLPQRLSRRVNFRVGHYLVVLLSMAAVLAMVLAVVYYQEDQLTRVSMLEGPFIKVYALLLLAAAVCAWWVVLASESRRLAHDESRRHNQLLQLEIDAHRRTDAALQAAKDLAEAANQAKTRYVTGMTHELRTPLNSVVGYAQILLKRKQRDDPEEEALTTIQRSGEHLIALIDGLLDLARIEAGRLRLDPVPLPLHEFLEEVVRMVQPQADAKGVRCGLETLGRLPTWVQADAKRLRQILLNLLGNAARFTDRGSITLRVDARREVLRFEVIDTGIGIAPQDLERIFLPFERGSAGRRRSDPGTGLGLTITHLLTELMGGDLSVQSVLGQGSTFSLRLYLRQINTPEALPGVQGKRQRHRQIIGHVGARRTLLMVDDQPTQRHMLAGLLRPLGFELREAASGQECLESVLESRPDAVLMDVSMDDLDGWETARQLRAMGCMEMPIIIVSANVFQNQPERLAASRCQAFVAKPVIESELLDTLEDLLKLEWTFLDTHPVLPMEGALPLAATRTDACAFAADLPPGEVADLCRLARIGQARALRRKLAELALQHPQWEREWQHLIDLAERFDFEALVERMNPALPEDALDESET